MHIFRQPAETEVHRLLNAADLPTTDLKTQNFEHFFGLGSEQGLKGVIGLEIYGPNALLRSLAVETGNRGHGYGKALVAETERYAQRRGVKHLYLLTTTAKQFFERLGYTATERGNAPESICATSEFSSLCPLNSAFMVKVLRSGQGSSIDVENHTTE
ncbi:MAG TPA: arsenic resistance N-acetyltransferase ArsN2 [Syntrophales bacterium]|nr:arsenic resistance N-acetyltransferase ArsN2 [Syntrophales bacterium]